MATKYESPVDLIHDAYRRLDHEQLVFFLEVRQLPTSGNDAELAARLAQFDLTAYKIERKLENITIVEDPSASTSLPLSPPDSAVTRPRTLTHLDFPVEILAEIMDHVNDWELAKAVGIPTSLPRPQEWTRASSTDEAMLSGFLPVLRAANPAQTPPTKIGATLAIRFGYVNVLEYFLIHHRPIFTSLFQGAIIPITASFHGRTHVLSWWRRASEQDHNRDVLPTLTPSCVAECVDGASRNGQVLSLDWWLASGIPLEYTDTALEYASARNHIPVLEWWRQTKLPLKIGRVMDMASTAGHVGVLEWWFRYEHDIHYDKQALYHASCHGKVEVLQWWLNSGLQLMFDQDVLVGATKHNRPEVLEWWDRSGLPVQYRMCDIEEALEDAIGGGEAARDWWLRKGVDFNTNDKEWMKLQYLNP
ncbi:hypothetical protein PUNSTDRAFT_136570 [Punctularia strigosozonata HHB-11173 SS5]|uniref:uncharacterized protein n=1 Tax=Punctularia strigosozonata (strain HHB-11173) TaxID=741275 RepID=UPI0004417907|nr:uncharacterized protein PUNSTDRAFT_136570 [Punctularia strigosozonata HHB-11173 SS5]EIN06732.1 hypothetical protein PUNSTDRAFT_136570 [Punctularia strigosozonata HHB-11173 SS5]